MEIKELAPKSKEVIVASKTDGVFCDAFSYEIKAETGNKKYLYIVSQIEGQDSSLGYIPNLIASFVKRELEANASTSSAQGSIDEHLLFEKALQRTNELIEGIFKDQKELKLDLGIALIKNEKIMASRLGRAKLIACQKSGHIFDVFDPAALNPATLSSGVSNKARGGRGSNKKFSNIISGDLKNGEKFFLFAPNKQISFKQKQIVAALAKNDQSSFSEAVNKTVPLAHLAGIHFEINEEMKKIAEQTTPPKIAAPSVEAPIVATEVAKINRSDTLIRTADRFKKMVMGDNSEKRKWRLNPRGINYSVIIAAILIVAAAFFFFTRGSSKFKKELAAINENLKVSESKFLLKNTYEARKFLNDAFNRLKTLEEGKGKEKAEAAALDLQSRIEKIDSSAKPVEVSQPEGLIKNILEIAQTQNVPVNQVLIKDKKAVIYSPDNPAALSSGASIKIINLDSGKTTELKKKFSFEPIEFKNYEDNLYFLGQKNIHKIPNALEKPLAESEWLKSNEALKIPGNFVSFDLDSTVYALTDERKLAVLFKGALVKLVDLDFDVGPGTELVNLGGGELAAIDKKTKLARIITDSGELEKSYTLSPIDSVTDVFFDKESRTLWLLSPEKVWSLKI